MLTWEKRLGWVSLVVYLLFTAFCMFFNGLYTGYPETDWSDCCPAWEIEGCWIQFKAVNYILPFFILWLLIIYLLIQKSDIINITYIDTLYFLFIQIEIFYYIFFFLQMLKHALTLWCWLYNWLIGFINPCSQQVPQYCSSCKGV